MLQKIREKFTGTFALVILALIGIPFVFFGINYNFVGSSFAAKIDGEEISGLSTLFRKIWSLGDAGVTVPLTLHRDSQIVSVTVESAARADYLKKPRVN